MSAALGRRAREHQVEQVARLEVDHGQDAVVLHRAAKALIERGGIGDVVIDGAHEDRVAAAGREVRLALPCPDHRDVAEARLGNGGSDVRQALRVELGRIDPAVRGEPARYLDGHRAAPGADLGDRHAGLDAKDRGETVRLS